MLNQATLDKMHQMKLSAMAEAFEQQRASTQWTELTFEERLGILIDSEWTSRQNRKLVRRLKAAKLRYAVSIEDVDFHAPRGIERQTILSLATCSWITEHQNVILTGKTGTGKTFLACALTERACRSDFSAYYVRTPRLLHDLEVARGDGSYTRLLAKLAKFNLLALDDWLIAPLKDHQRRDLLEIIEDRYESQSTLIATQLPIASWHEVIGEPTLADAICDRLIHRAHRIDLTGDSMRKQTENTSSVKKEKKTTKTKKA
jgi:DNA replication protein DnaC